MASHTPREHELIDHLTELRNRILRILIAVIIGWIIGWLQFTPAYEILYRPLEEPLKQVAGKLVFMHLSDGFFLKVQLSFVLGLLLVMPYILYEIWAFVAPALTAEERKEASWFLPFSASLFFLGVGLGYWMLPAAFNWFISYIKDFGAGSAQLFQNPLQFVLLTVKILLAFGVSFELPVVIILAAKLGLVTSAKLNTYWRHAIVVIATFAAIITPTSDPLSMTILTVPMVVLYFLTITIVKGIETQKAKAQAKAAKLQQF
ncbi:MAG: twin-arginine translocase subunit TatC [Armatimonadota bacterium]